MPCSNLLTLKKVFYLGAFTHLRCFFLDRCLALLSYRSLLICVIFLSFVFWALPRALPRRYSSKNEPYSADILLLENIMEYFQASQGNCFRRLISRCSSAMTPIIIKTAIFRTSPLQLLLDKSHPRKRKSKCR